MVRPRQRAAARAIFGQQPVTGKLPVSIPGLHNFAEGITIPPEAIADCVIPGRTLREASPYAAGFTRDFEAKLDSVLAAGVADSVAPGVVCAAGRRGMLFYNRAFGTMTYEPDAAPVTTRSIFDLASLTKVTATTTLGSP